MGFCFRMFESMSITTKRKVGQKNGGGSKGPFFLGWCYGSHFTFFSPHC